MSDQHIDPAGNTQQFRAFAQRREQEAQAAPKKSPVLPIDQTPFSSAARP